MWKEKYQLINCVFDGNYENQLLYGDSLKVVLLNISFATYFGHENDQVF